MNVQLPMRLDKPAFLAWVQGREERYELADGRVVMMTGASRTHGLLVLNIAMLLRGQLDPRSVIADFGLDAGPKTLRYPDVMVRSEEHTSELQSRQYLVCRLLLEKKKKKKRPDWA